MKPELLFRLRAVNENDLVANVDKALPMSKRPAAGRVLEIDDVSAIFGLDMAGIGTAVEAAGDAQIAAVRPVTRARFSSADGEASRHRDGSKMTRCGEPSFKPAVPNKAASRKRAKEAMPKAATARDPKPPAKTSGHLAHVPKAAVVKKGTSASQGSKTAPAAKTREPRPVRWWLSSTQAKAQKS